MFIGAGLRGATLVERLERAYEQERLGSRRCRLGLERLNEVVPTLALHRCIQKHHIGLKLTSLRDARVGIVDHVHLVVLMGKGDFNDLLKGLAILDEQELLGHLAIPSGSPTTPRCPCEDITRPRSEHMS